MNNELLETHGDCRYINLIDNKTHILNMKYMNENHGTPVVPTKLVREALLEIENRVDHIRELIGDERYSDADSELDDLYEAL